MIVKYCDCTDISAIKHVKKRRLDAIGINNCLQLLITAFIKAWSFNIPQGICCRNQLFLATLKNKYCFGFFSTILKFSRTL
jgi:hypothetical protein